MSDTSRIDELAGLLKSLQRDAAAEDRNVLATDIAALEDEMVENREHLTVLLSRGIIDEALYFEKLRTCFRVFLDCVSAKYGSEVCKHVYGFEHGLEFSAAQEQVIAAKAAVQLVGTPELGTVRESPWIEHIVGRITKRLDEFLNPWPQDIMFRGFHPSSGRLGGRFAFRSMRAEVKLIEDDPDTYYMPYLFLSGYHKFRPNVHASKQVQVRVLLTQQIKRREKFIKSLKAILQSFKDELLLAQM